MSTAPMLSSSMLLLFILLVLVLPDASLGTYPFTVVQVGSKVTATGSSGSPLFGAFVAISADASTAVVGGPGDNSKVGAVWVLTRSAFATWAIQGGKVSPPSSPASGQMGYSVAINDKGTVIVAGAPKNSAPCAYILTRSGATTAVASTISPSDGTSTTLFGYSVAVAGNVVVVGGPSDGSGAGAIWVYSTAGGAQAAPKLTGAGSSNGNVGHSVAISADAGTIAAGGPTDTSRVGAVWVFTRIAAAPAIAFAAMGAKLTVGASRVGLGTAVALDGTGATLVVGATAAHAYEGSVAVFSRNAAAGTFTLLQIATPTDEANSQASLFGQAVSVTLDGLVAAVGGPLDSGNSYYDYETSKGDVGAVWVLRRPSLAANFSLFPKLAPTGVAGTGANVGHSVSIGMDGSIFAGGWLDNSFAGATWLFAINAAPCLAPASTTSTSYASCYSVSYNSSVCSLQCMPGYNATGPIPATCLAGTYVLPPSAGTCKPLITGQCTALPAVVSGGTAGTCTTTPVANGGTCTQTCLSNYTVAGSLTFTCTNGTFSAVAGVCNPNCAALFSLPAYASYGSCAANFLSGGTCSIACVATASLTAGSVVATCATTGVWSPPTATCTPNPCPLPADTASTVYSAACPVSVLSGSTCTPTCAAGYTASASLTITCSAGVFSTPAGTCAPNPCPRPADTASTVYAQASCPSPTPSASVCIPSCQIGYNATASIALTCALGNFSAPAGTCAPNPCPLPADTASTIYSAACPPSVASGSACTPSCAAGYTASAPLTINCTAGTFSIPAVACAPSPCPRPADTASTIFSQSSCPSPTPSGSACTPTCQPGFTPNGTLTLACTLGVFAAPAGVCRPNPCPLPANTSSTLYASASCPNPVPSGSACTPLCQSGYTPSASLTIACSAGAFSTPAGTCNPAPCPAPTPAAPVTAGSCGASTASGSSCVLGCASGYVANGSLAVTCSFGSFSAATGICVVAVGNLCSQPTPPFPLLPGTCPSSVHNGTTCQLQCATGYTPNPTGNFNVTCVNSQFTAPPLSAVCTENACTLPTLPVGTTAGSCAATQPGSSSCTLACAPGYAASGLFNLTCTAGVFSSFAGTCTPLSCTQSSLTVALAAGQTISGACPALVPSDSSCSVVCAAGYSAGTSNTSVVATCNLGVFSSTAALACAANDCPVPTNLAAAGLSTGTCPSTSVSAGSACALACLPGYTASAGSTFSATCTAGVLGGWTATCTPNSCPQPVPPPATATTVGNCPAVTPSGQSCSLGCLPTFTPLGTFTATCQAGAFVSQGAGFCVGVGAVSAPVVSPGSVLTITLSSSIGTFPADMDVTAYSLDGVVSSAATAFAVPDLGVANATAALAVFVSSPSLGLVNAPLTAYAGTVEYFALPALKSACPTTITSGITVSVLVQGSGFAATPFLRCILNGRLAFPATVNNPGTVNCELNWPNGTANEILDLSITNDGVFNAAASTLPITVTGACDSLIKGSLSIGNTCQCPTGTFTTATACQPCPIGTFQNQTGQPSCTPCGANEDTNLAVGSTSAAACVCQPLFYYGVRQRRCLPCVTGMTCPGNNVVIIQRGYWRASGATSKVVACPGGTAACLGGNVSSLPFSSPSPCCTGYTGPMCAVCAGGYAAVGATCAQCLQRSYNGLLLAALLLLMVLLAYLLVKSASSFEALGALSSSSSSSAEKAERQRQGSLAVIVKVTLNYLQVLFYIGRLSSNWGDVAHRFLEAVGIVSALSPDNYIVHCAATWRFYDTLTLVFLSPAIVAIVVTAIYFCRHFIRGLDLATTRTEHQLALMLLLYQIHPTIMLELINAFPCIHVPGTHTSYLKRDLSVDCRSSRYKSFAAIAAVYLVVYVFGLLALVMWRLRRNVALGNLANRTHTSHFKYAFFYAGYRSETYYWEGVIMLRKIAVVAFSVLPSALLQLTFGNVAIVAAWLLSVRWRPFSSPFVNRLESASLGVLFTTIILGLLFVNADSGSNTIWISVLVILVNIAMISLLLACCLRRLRAYLGRIRDCLPAFLLPADDPDSIVMTKNRNSSISAASSKRPSTSIEMTDTI